MISIIIFGDKATIKDGIWNSSVDGMADYLNKLSDAFTPSGSDTTPDYSKALWVINNIGGEIISKPYKYDNKRIY
jgi:hypothetical protein